MSGGSYEYAYRVVEQFAEALELGVKFDGDAADGAASELRPQFAAHLRKVAAAMKAIEWEDSFDTSPPLADQAIQRALSN
jgi:hypothetical protein